MKVIACEVIAYSHTELWSFRITNLDVCGSLVLSNPVTYAYFHELYKLILALVFTRSMAGSLVSGGRNS